MSRSTRLASAGLVAAAVLAIAACGTSTSSGGVAGRDRHPGDQRCATRVGKRAGVHGALGLGQPRPERP